MAAGESDAKIKRFIKNSKSAFKQLISDLPENQPINPYALRGGLTSTDLLKYPNLSIDEIIKLKEEQKEKERIEREKFSKRIGLEDRYENGNISEEEFKLESQKLDEIYDNSKNDGDLYFNNLRVKNKYNKDISEKEREVIFENINYDELLYTDYDKSISAQDALSKGLSLAELLDTDFDGNVDSEERKMFDQRQSHKNVVTDGFNNFIETGDSQDFKDLQVIDRGNFTPSPYGGGMYDDGTVVDSAGNIITYETPEEKEQREEYNKKVRNLDHLIRDVRAYYQRRTVRERKAENKQFSDLR